MLTEKKQQLDEALQTVIGKIDTGTVTCEDFNRLITKTMIGESTPEAIRDRVRRRTSRNETDSHIDNETGHQQLQLPTMAARVQPKRQPVNQQSHGRADMAHAQSAKTQQKTMAASLREAVVPEKFQSSLNFLVENCEEPLSEDLMAIVPNKVFLRALATKLMSRPGINQDWLYALIQKLG